MPLPTSGQMSYSDLANEFGGANSSVGTGGTRTYNVAGSYAYTIPPGVTSIQYLIVSGGGGGGNGVAPIPAVGYCAAQPGAGGGGGGAGQVNASSKVVTPGETLSIVVGAGGAAGASGGVSSITGISGVNNVQAGSAGATAVTGTGGAGGGSFAYSGGAGSAQAGGGGAGTTVSGSAGCGVSGGSGGAGTYIHIPGCTQTSFGSPLLKLFGIGGGGGTTGGAMAGGGGSACGGYGGNDGNAATMAIGIPGAGGGGGGGGSFLNGAQGTAGVVHLYAPATMTNVNIENYYRGQGYVPDIYRNQGVPYWVSGTHPSITVGTDFYNATNLFYWNYALGSGLYATGLCILAAATADGYANDKPLIATVTINGVLGASATSTYALDTGTGYNAVPTITVNVGASGIISGHGGGGLYCSGGTVLGGDGGTAINLQVPTTVNNNGIIQGGGAAAAAERGVYPGGAGYGYGVGVQGNQGTVNQNGTVESGGALQAQKTGKKSTGYSGYGGGWVSEDGQSPSTNGYATTGGYIPGNGFTAGSVANLNLAVHGTIRGLCGL